MAELDDAQAEAMWRDVLINGHRHRMSFLPGSHRCSVCRLPFDGIGGTVLKPLGRKASRKSPNLCNL